MRSPKFIRLALMLAALIIVFVPRKAAAQDGFLFRPPVVGLTFRAGPTVLNAGGDLFDEMTTRLTLDRSDFRTASAGADLVFTPSNRFDIVASLLVAQVKSNSEFEEWVDFDPVTQQEIGIKQTTRYQVIPFSLSARYQLFPRGRRISELAWLPRRLAPYVGAGVGITWYKLEQVGDFVDETANPEAPPIFWDQFESAGEGFTVHGLAGVDYWVTSHIGVNMEARYTHGSAVPNRSYHSYDTIDLSGAHATLGLSFRW